MFDRLPRFARNDLIRQRTQMSDRLPRFARNDLIRLRTQMPDGLPRFARNDLKQKSLRGNVVTEVIPKTKDANV